MAKPTDATPAEIALDHDAPVVPTAARKSPARVVDGDLARLVAEGKVGTAEVLGMREEDVLGGGWGDDAAVVAQIDDYLRKDNAQSRRGGEYKAWEAKYPEWVAWRNRLTELRSGPGPAADLGRIVAEQARARKRGELLRDAETYLRDRHLEWREHEKMLALAKQLGVSDADVEWAYAEVARRGGFEMTRSEPPPPPAAANEQMGGRLDLGSFQANEPRSGGRAPSPVGVRPQYAPPSARVLPGSSRSSTSSGIGVWLALGAVGGLAVIGVAVAMSSGAKESETSSTSSPRGKRTASPTVASPGEPPVISPSTPSTPSPDPNGQVGTLDTAPTSPTKTAMEWANICWCDLGHCKDKKTADYAQARIDCELGLAAKPGEPFLGYLLYDMCLIEEHDGHLEKAAVSCERSLAVRTDPSGRAIVNQQLCRIHCRQKPCITQDGGGPDNCETEQQKCKSACL